MSAAKKKKNSKKKGSSKKSSKKNYSKKNLQNNVKANSVQNKDVKKEEIKEEQVVPSETIVEEKELHNPETVSEENVAEEVKTPEVKEEKPEEKVEESKKEKKPKKEKKKKEEIKEEQKTEEVKKESKDEKPEYVKEMLRRKKIKIALIVLSIMIVLIVIGISTLFALFFKGKTTIVNNTFIQGIDVSNLGKEEAVEKVTNEVTPKIIKEITLKYGNDLTFNMETSLIDFKYDYETAVDKVFSIGREKSLVENNYDILFAKLFGNKIELDYTYNEEELDAYIESINSQLPGVVVDPGHYIEGDKLIVERGTDGIEITKDVLKHNILEAIDESSKGSPASTVEIPTNEAKAKDIDMDKIYEEIHTEPQDAYYTLEPYQIFPDKDGIDLLEGLDSAKSKITSEYKDKYEFQLKISKAEKTIRDLGTEAFPYLISSFSTKYDASNINRSTNLEIAANKINGKVLMPGEVFSFNDVVGKRTIEEGYRDAKIYADGGVVDGLAGGICQISSTLYNSVLLANLEIVERHNHSFVTSYLEAGKDATVVYGVKDFKFKNTRSYPIKIEASVKNGIAKFQIHGMQEEKEYEIKILPVRTGTIGTPVVYQPDPSLAPGQQKTIQSGHPGCRVTTYKEVSYNGEVISKEAISNDTYNAMKTIIAVGP